MRIVDENTDEVFPTQIASVGLDAEPPREVMGPRAVKNVRPPT